MEKVILKVGKERSLLNKHPWVFNGAIKTMPKGLKAGELVSVYSAKNQFLGNGYFNADSQITVRIYSWHKKELLDRDLLRWKITQSIGRRSHIDRSHTNCIRLVAHDADFLPGLVIDQYNQWVSMPAVNIWKDTHWLY